MISPSLHFSVLCDDVRREDNGKLMLIGLFERLRSNEFPCRHPKLVVANRWCNGIGEFTQRTRLMSPDDDELVSDRETRFELPDIHHVHTVVSVFGGVEFPVPGTYAVEVLLNEELHLRYSLMVEPNE